MRLNCDLGEGFPEVDAAVMPYIDMANIACGGHASDAIGMRNTVELAKQYKVSIGAHPSYEDKANFGRLDIELNSGDIESLINRQVLALNEICHRVNVTLDYVKLHGALYNRMMHDQSTFKAILSAVAKTDLPLMVLAKADMQPYESLATHFGVTLIKEVFCDRGYLANGELVPRNQSGALLNDTQIAERIDDLLIKNRLKVEGGSYLTIQADSICVHGDSPDALESVKQVYTRLNHV